ncbi:VOC family protein [Pseudooceanicola sp.]|uniref:VOC family protein n=1 Tax=Pseudooceanicola sp. TaxID=1914328 RepID=UPI00262F3BA6|nr:VOC family protein [Pseudooceanicola sp.]MDF1854093.1 VOC family protein [Pseudooceanicola sp.]
MIDHISVAVRDLRIARDFYDKVLKSLNYTVLAERPHTVGFGKRYPEFWLNHRPDMGPVPGDTGVHICLRAPSKAAVQAFHAAALAAGGQSDGAPGPRQGEMTGYYGAFIKDPDGNKIEAVSFPAPA